MVPLRLKSIPGSGLEVLGDSGRSVDVAHDGRRVKVLDGRVAGRRPDEGSNRRGAVIEIDRVVPDRPHPSVGVDLANKSSGEDGDGEFEKHVDKSSRVGGIEFKGVC